jgi:hypothetical protein
MIFGFHRAGQTGRILRAFAWPDPAAARRIVETKTGVGGKLGKHFWNFFCSCAWLE